MTVTEYINSIFNTLELETETNSSNDTLDNKTFSVLLSESTKVTSVPAEAFYIGTYTTMYDFSDCTYYFYDIDGDIVHTLSVYNYID